MILERSSMSLLRFYSPSAYLEMSFVALPKTLPITLPDFSSLHEMSFSNGALSDYAPLLTHLPNLEKLDSVGLNIHPPNVELIFQTPSPTFNLQHLRLCQCSLSPEESKWLLGSSRNIAYAELLELGSDAFTTRRTVAVSFASVPRPIPVVKAICDTVRSLHIKGMLDASQQGDPRFVTEIRRFVRLKALKVSGRDWPWESMLRAIAAPLESFTLSYSTLGLTYVSTILRDHTWMPGLLDITVYHWVDTDYFYGVEQADVKADRAVLEDACSARQVALRWVTEGNAREVDQSYPGIAEDDFIRFPSFWSPQSHLSQNAY